VQAQEPVQDTPLRTLSSESEVSGLGTIDQLVPSQDSMRVCSNELLIENPTAVQEETEAHDTPLRPLFSVGEVPGLGTIDQLVPSQDSMRVCSKGGLLPENPTAVQDEDEVQDTPFRKLISAGEVSGLGTIDQLVPTQDSTRVWSDPDAFTYWPTAIQAEIEVHDTPLRSLSCLFEVLGLGRMDHFAPFQVSTSVWLTNPRRREAEPTAVHHEEEIHDTSERASSPRRALGLETIDQFLPVRDSTRVRSPPFLLST
jgi:hypothetical protein